MASTVKTSKKAAPVNAMAAFRKDKKLKLFLAGCVLPPLALTICFVLIPAMNVFVMSCFDRTALSKGNGNFIGLENYLYLLKDEYFIKALTNTLLLMLTVPIITLTLSLLTAVVITQSKLRERKFYRVVLFMPSILSTTVIGILWSFIYHPNMGILNQLLKAIGLESWMHAWLGDPKVALMAIGIVMVWVNVGYYMVMYIAGIDNISPDIYEAATIDGANVVHKLVRITLPLLMGTIQTTIVLCISTVLSSSFLFVTVMTSGGPAGSTSVLLQYMYSQAFGQANFGYAMAVAVVTLGMAFLLAKLSNKLTEER